MAGEARKMVQVVLAVAIVAAAVRLLLIYRSRYARVAQPSRQEAPLDADYYVSRKKLYAYDLNSAKELTRQPVWVREGYRWVYYGYDPRTHRADFGREAGLLGPLERLQVTDVELSQPAPVTVGSKRVGLRRRRVLAAFRKENRDYAIPIGEKYEGSFQIYADEIFFLQDPRALYKHWPSAVWQAIEQHQVRPGMNELQVSFALGVGFPEPSSGNTKIVRYPNDGRPVQITYENGRAASIKPAG